MPLSRSSPGTSATSKSASPYSKSSGGSTRWPGSPRRPTASAISIPISSNCLRWNPGSTKPNWKPSSPKRPRSSRPKPRPSEAQVKAKRYKLKAHPGRESLPAHLRREDILIDEPPAPLPGGLPPQELRRDITERLAVVPAEYYVERITTVSYIFPGEPDKGVYRGAGPAALLPKSILGPSVAIDFVIAKYADHQPVYRLVTALARDHGIELSYPTADRAVIDTAALAMPWPTPS
jgi:transposase